MRLATSAVGGREPSCRNAQSQCSRCCPEPVATVRAQRHHHLVGNGERFTGQKNSTCPRMSAGSKQSLMKCRKRTISPMERAPCLEYTMPACSLPA